VRYDTHHIEENNNIVETLDEIPLVLSPQEIADMIGTTIETSIRIMSRWGKENLVRTERDGS
jgi:CRP-like cAMP-binding protein